MTGPASPAVRAGTWREVLRAFLVLGLSSFGGPVAHLGYFRREFVDRRRWLDEGAYADLVALCQILPGPASSQVGMALGLLRAGPAGGLAAWLGFTLPSALLMLACAGLLGVRSAALSIPSALVHGLKLLAVAVVAQAIWSMGRSLCAERRRASIAVAAAVAGLLWSGALMQVAVCAGGALCGLLLLRDAPSLPEAGFGAALPPRSGALLLLLFLLLLLALPLAAHWSSAPWLQLADRFYRAGALVFGGGHVVLPTLQAAVVTPGWIDGERFLAGYGAAQALPGPLFSFAAFLGAAGTVPPGSAPGGWPGGALALLSIFLPGALLVAGMLPLWARVRRHPRLRAALPGVNAAVVGLLIAAFYDFIWRATIQNGRDFAIALSGLLLLVFWRLPPWAVMGWTVLAAFLAAGT